MPRPELAPYLETVNAPTPTTHDEMIAACTVFTRAANTFGARLALELTELAEIHAAEADRVAAVQASGQSMTGERIFDSLLDNAMSRSRFVQIELQGITGALTRLRRGLTDLGVDRKALIDLDASTPSTPTV